MLPDIRSRKKKKTEGCDCPACQGLVCLERPRYFAGQLLTETELNDAQAYALAKHRLHNRYLHGSGVVCGLQVTCHDCEGWVTVHSGYALDPCGNDIVVCESHDFDLIKAIRACRQEKRRERDCDPWREPFREQCRDVEETWCITIRYREREAQPTSSLVSSSASSCGCGGSECGHRQGRKNGRSTTVTQCEPTRIVESYELGVVRMPGDEDDKEGIWMQLVEALQKLGVSIPYEALLSCYQTVLDFAQRAQNIANLLAEDPFGRAATIYRDLCRLREDLRDHLLEGERLTCELVDRLGRVVCPPPPIQDDGVEEFAAGVRQAIREMQAILIAYLLDCICFHALPTCPGDVCEDRLILACVTVRGDRILRICHTEGRRYVLTPHNALLAVLNLFLDQICCTDLQRQFLVDRQPGVVGVAETASAFTARSRPLAAAAEIFNTVGFRQPEAAARARVSAENLVGRRADSVRATLEEQAPLVEEEVVTWDAREAITRNLAQPFVRTDQPIRLYVDESGTIVGVGQSSEADRLRRELDSATERINRLELQLNRMAGENG